MSKAKVAKPMARPVAIRGRTPNGVAHTIEVGTVFAWYGAYCEVTKIGRRGDRVTVRPSVPFRGSLERKPFKLKIEEVFKALDRPDDPPPTSPEDVKVGTTFVHWGGQVCEVSRVGKRRRKVWVRRVRTQDDTPSPVSVEMEMRMEEVLDMCGASDAADPDWNSPFQVGVRECGLSDEREAESEREAGMERVLARASMVITCGVDWEGTLYTEGEYVEVDVRNPEEYDHNTSLHGTISEIEEHSMGVGGRVVQLADITNLVPIGVVTA